MTKKRSAASIRVLPETVANKIAAGEVVERPASVVKELVENSLDSGATRITVRIVGAGRRRIEVVDNGHGMSEQDALLAVERHSTSKIRKADDLDDIQTLGFRGEALASIAAVSRFELITRREKDEAATRVAIDGGIMREVTEVGAPVGTRVLVNRLYFNTPVRAKFLKGVTTELSHCIDAVQRHALSHEGVGFQVYHNDKMLLDIPEHATLRERVALIWGLTFVNDMVEISGEQAGFTVRGLVGTPALSRSSRSHQFFFINGRPVVNRSLQYGFEDGYQTLLTIGRRPVGVVMMETHPRFVDVNIHPAKREIRFRDERAARDAIRDIVRATMESVRTAREEPAVAVGEARTAPSPIAEMPPQTHTSVTYDTPTVARVSSTPPPTEVEHVEQEKSVNDVQPAKSDEQPELPMGQDPPSVAPEAVYRSVDQFGDEALQLFETYLLIPEDDRLLIIDQHALHERLNYDSLVTDLEDNDYEAQSLAVPILVDVPPSHARLLESNLDIFSQLGLEIEPFGNGAFQVSAICHLYDDSRVADMIYHVLDELAQGNLFDRDGFLSDLLRLATEACRASVKAGDRLSAEEKQALIQGFRRLRPPYTCPHGRPIITELTIAQMEKSFRRRQ